MSFYVQVVDPQGAEREGAPVAVNRRYLLPEMNELIKERYGEALTAVLKAAKPGAEGSFYHLAWIRE